jgi:hypothetical protein
VSGACRAQALHRHKTCRKWVMWKRCRLAVSWTVTARPMVRDGDGAEHRKKRGAEQREEHVRCRGRITSQWLTGYGKEGALHRWRRSDVGDVSTAEEGQWWSHIRAARRGRRSIERLLNAKQYRLCLDPSKSALCKIRFSVTSNLRYIYGVLNVDKIKN